MAASRALAGLKEKGYKTSVDVVSEEGDRYRKVILPCLKYTDYLIINEVEAGNCLGMSLRDAQGHITFSAAEAAARELLALGVNDLVVIHFPEGGVAVSADGRSAVRASESPDPSQIVSTVGAGDAFCAGVLYSIHEGFDLDRMLLFANTSARFNLFSATSTGGAPTLKQVEEYMKTRI